MMTAIVPSLVVRGLNEFLGETCFDLKFCDFGLPRLLQSDNGSEFVNELMNKFSEAAGFDHRLITPYHPRANGIAERWVQSAVKGIRKQMNGAIKDWDKATPAVQLALNTKISERHQSRPFALMFNRTLNEFKDYTKDKNVRQISVEEMQEAIKKMKEIVLPAINERTNSVNESRKKKFDKEKTITEFTKGDQVMVRVRNKQGKLDAECEGPYTIVRKNKGGAYTLKDLQGELEARDHVPSELKLVLPRKDVNAEDKNFTVDRIVAHKKEPNNGYTVTHKMFQ